ncbi:MAG: gamma-glutamyl-gamma-aminobutyrate hydrolase family protein [Chthoniobacteraceae bacterium]
MPQIVSWIRECDRENFGRFFTRHPEVRVQNARVEPVDIEAAAGLLITGGADISAQFLDQPVADVSWIRDPDPLRDAWEFAAIRRAYARGLPMLCICKGMQMLNVALGGTLLLDIPGHDLPETRTANVQPLRHATSALHRFEKVNSSHHQALDALADALEVEAWHAGDGISEQVRIRDYPWGIGVQYHPERDPMYAVLFEDFIARVR